MQTPITRRALVIGAAVTSIATLFPISTPARRVRQDAIPVAMPEAFGLVSGSSLTNLGLPEINVTISADAFTVSEREIAAGRYLVTLENQHEEMLSIVFQELPEDVTIDEVTALLTDMEVTGPPDWYYSVRSAGGATAQSGESTRFIVDLEAGRYMVHWDNVIPGLAAHELVVTGDVPGDLPQVEADVAIEMVDMAFSLGGALTPGDHIIRFTNAGEQPHVASFMGVPDGTTVQDFLGLVASFSAGPEATPVATSLSFNDVSETFMTGMLSPGETMWSEVSLDPGTYLLVCYVPDAESGAPHAMLGMVEVYVVA